MRAAHAARSDIRRFSGGVAAATLGGEAGLRRGGGCLEWPATRRRVGGRGALGVHSERSTRRLLSRVNGVRINAMYR